MRQALPLGFSCPWRDRAHGCWSRKCQGEVGLVAIIEGALIACAMAALAGPLPVPTARPFQHRHIPHATQWYGILGTGK